MAQLRERFEAMVFAERCAARLEERLRREHENPHSVWYPYFRLRSELRCHRKVQFYSLMKRPGLKTALAVVKLTVSAGLLAVLFNRADLRTMLTQFRQMNLAWMSAALGMYGLMLLVSAWRWRLLLKIQAVHVRFGILTKSFLVATLLQQLPAEQHRRRRHPRRRHRALHRVEDARDYGRAGRSHPRTDRAARRRGAGVRAGHRSAVCRSTAACGSGSRWLRSASACWSSCAGRPCSPALIHAAGSGRAEAIQTRLHNLVGAIHRFAGQPRPVWFAFAGALGVQLLLVLFYICAARSLAVPFPLLAASVIVPISLAVQMAPLSINGFGVREAVFAFFFTSLGLDVSSALTLSLGSAC